jgi:RND family efflux transporter MFP subunit
MSALENKKRILSIIIVLIPFVVAGMIFAFRNGDDKLEVVEVVRRDLMETVNIAGTVKADITSELGFQISGPVRNIAAEEGERVSRGQRLASLDLGTLPAELKSAEAGVALIKASTGNTNINLQALEEKHNTLVTNAYRKLLSSDLEAIPVSESTTITAPTVSGLYVGGEGRYEIVIRPGPINDQFYLHIYGLGGAEPVRVSENKAIPLGDGGLFVSFPRGPRPYSGINWYVEIPNKRGASYTTNYNAYLDAIRERDRALEEARSALRGESAGSSIADAELAQAEAQVERIQAEIAQRYIYAPFGGVITDVSINPGEIVTAGQQAISMISDGQFGVEVELPEVDSVKVKLEDTAEVILDAIGNDATFPAKVVSVNRTETIVNGVSVYKARLAFVEDPTASDDAWVSERIASGMTADVTIVTDSREDVLALPARAIRYKENGESFVILKKGEEREEAPVTTGLRSTDGYIEIMVGLKEGDIVAVENT